MKKASNRIIGKDKKERAVAVNVRNVLNVGVDSEIQLQKLPINPVVNTLSLTSINGGGTAWVPLNTVVNTASLTSIWSLTQS